jgi:hypothetical protein
MFLVAVAVGIGFGAGDQYLGSLATAGLWTVSLSQLSAPWLLLPFVFGCSQLRLNRAALIGLVATVAGLFGYFLMTLGPFDAGHASLNLHAARGVLTSNAWVIAGGLVTGPFYGLLGQRWRTRRAWVSAILVAGAFCLEPLAETAANRTFPGASTVWPLEVVVGLLLAAYFLVTGMAYRRSADWRRKGLNSYVRDEGPQPASLEAQDGAHR